MRIHHLNCISTCPLGGFLMDRRSVGLRGRLTCHCLLIETPGALVLVDTGFGVRDVLDPRGRLSAFFRFLVAPELREEMTAIRQIQRLGHDPADVRHIVLTHLDFDHAGGLDDFPWATAHVMADELQAAVARPTWMDQQRYRPQQWADRSRWDRHTISRGEGWFGFECVRALRGLPPEILMIPLRGHTLGHAGVAVRSDRGWILQAGDAYFDHREMDPCRPRCTPGLRFYQWMLEKDRPARLRNQELLRKLATEQDGMVRIISSHDVPEFERLAGHRFDQPATALAH